MSAVLTQTERYWLGRLSMALAMAHAFPEAAKRCVQDYMRSNVCTDEQRDRLRKELRSGNRH